MGMRAEEVGAYIRLLCYQFGNGAIPIDDMEAVEIIAGTKRLDKVLKKFPGGVNGKLKGVKEEGDRISEKRKQAGSIGGTQTQAKLKQSTKQKSSKKSDSDTELKSELYSDINSNTKINKESEGEGSKVGFQPPALAEIIAYCQEAQLLKTDPKEFFDHFTSNGWKVGGKAPMKDWKAAIRNWERREKTFRSGSVDKSHVSHQRAQEFINKVKVMQGGGLQSAN